MQQNFEIETPHAAVMIWNYKDRLGAGKNSRDKTSSSIVDTIDTYRISTGDCVSIETSKSKGQPQGSFRLIVAPSTNWISAVTAGSWCCIFMSTEKIEFENITQSKSSGTNKKNTLKMIGKIESVRLETQMGEDGARRSLYYISGVDWGHVFNNILYVDPAVAAAGDTGTQGNLLYAQLRNLFVGPDGKTQYLGTNDVISSLTKIFGFNTSDINEAATKVGKLGKPVYELKFPKQLSDYLGLKSGQSVMSNIRTKFGTLKSYNSYTPITEAISLPSVLTLQGQYTLWQVMLENSNPALNEMFCEIDWDSGDSPNLVLYKRIKPFSFKSLSDSSDITNQLRSYFQFVKRHEIDKLRIISANIGTNWRDKFNYVQLRFDKQNLQILEKTIREGLERFDDVAFQREGFRPLIENTRQLPIKPQKEFDVRDTTFQPELGSNWVTLLREWYFDTHRMLNGTINIVGGSEYIGVGNNIRFELDIINPTNNMTKKVVQGKTKHYILAHVESVSNRFVVEAQNGARSYTTAIQFSRGIIVDGDNAVQDQGIVLDQDVSDVTVDEDLNSKNTIYTGHALNPSPFGKTKK